MLGGQGEEEWDEGVERGVGLRGVQVQQPVITREGGGRGILRERTERNKSATVGLLNDQLSYYPLRPERCLQS